MTNINITDDVIYDALKNIPRNSTPGIDGVPSIVLKECGNELVTPLKIFFDVSLKKGIIPTQCKQADIVPIFKGGDRS